MAPLKNGHVPQVLATEYASYRHDVIGKVLSVLADVQTGLERPLVLYDPMAGTAPLLPFAQRYGYIAYLNDLNTLHRYVNAAKTYHSYSTFTRVGSANLVSTLCTMTSEIDRSPRTPTGQWIENDVLQFLVRAWQKCGEQSKALCILARAILLLAIRDFASCSRSGNPTWLKPGGLRPPVLVQEAFQSAANRLVSFYEQMYGTKEIAKGGRVILTDHDASAYRPKQEVDVIVTSPPFCNRVDWDRLYAPEHFFLNAVGVWHTRAEFLGTTSVRGYDECESDMAFIATRSTYVRWLLRNVKSRQRPDECPSNYYVKYYTRYFSRLFRVFDTAMSALRDTSGAIYFVVQDNQHRGLRIDIGRALTQSLSSNGFEVRLRKTWNRPHLGLRNVSRRHRAVQVRQRERLWHAWR